MSLNATGVKFAHAKKGQSSILNNSKYRQIFQNLNGKKVIKSAYQASHVHKNSLFDVVIPPVTSAATNSLTATSTIVDFHIQPSDYILKQLTLQVSVSNGSSTDTVTPTVAPFFIQRVEIRVNGGSDLIQTIYGPALFLLNGIVMNNGQIASLSNVLNMNTSFAGPNALAISGTATYYIPIIGCFWESGSLGLPLNALTGLINVRFFFQNSVESGSGTLNVTSMQLHQQMLDIPSSDKSEIFKLFRNNPAEWDYLDQIQQDYTQTFTSSQENRNMRFTSWSGMDVAFAIAGLRSNPNTVTSGEWRTFSSIGAGATYVIYDANGVDITGGSKLNYHMERYVETAQEINSAMFTYLPLIPLFFSNPISSLAGIKVGGLEFTGNESIGITPDSSWTTATYTLTVWGFVWRTVRLQNGVFSRI